MTTVAPARPLRIDAQRNRSAILAAAAEVYAEQGCDSSLEAVARLAGVGVGTVYRRFPTKEALIEALLEGAMRTYAEQAETAATRAAAEPLQAFREHVLALVTAQAKDRAFSEVITAPSRMSPAFREYHRRALRASFAVVAAARSAGVVRADFEHRDLLLLTLANHGLVSSGAPSDVRSSLRLADLLLAGVVVQPGHDVGEDVR
jgi:AcrR family transcriptional regulator